MKAAYGRFILCLALFVGWLGYLGYLVAERPDGGMLVVSRPQILVSDIDVIAAIKKGSDTVTVKEVLSANDESLRQRLKGKEILVINLEDCRPPAERPGQPADVRADGDYLLPLQDPGPEGTEYRVAMTPPSPGFRHGTPRVYPATKDVLAQYRQIPKR
jgi:hypothetical protein